MRATWWRRGKALSEAYLKLLTTSQNSFLQMNYNNQSQQRYQRPSLKKTAAKTVARIFAHQVKVNVNKYLHISAVIEAVRALVSGNPERGYSQNAISFLEQGANWLDFSSRLCVCTCLKKAIIFTTDCVMPRNFPFTWPIALNEDKCLFDVQPMIVLTDCPVLAAASAGLSAQCWCSDQWKLTKLLPYSKVRAVAWHVVTVQASEMFGWFFSNPSPAERRTTRQNRLAA